MGSLGILRLDPASSSELSRRSRSWSLLDSRAPRESDALLVIGSPTDEALVLGAFQRPSEVAPADGALVVRRGSGGASAIVGPGTVWMQLSLGRPSALVPCTADKLLNRYVRPLLRALTRVSSVPASYFGRDWISAAHRPVGLVAFAHDAASGRCLFEAIVAVRAPFASSGRPSFLGKGPATLEDIAGRSIEPGLVAEAIAETYAALATETSTRDASSVASGAAPDLVEPEPAWGATREEAIGTIGAGRDATGRLRVGGELMASQDAVARLEELLAALPVPASGDDIGRAVDEALASSGAVTFGVRSLASIRDVVVDALGGEAVAR